MTHPDGAALGGPSHAAGGIRRPARRLVGAFVATLAALLALCTLGAGSAAAQEVACDPGDVEVRSLDFEGNRTFSDAELARGLAVTPSSWVRRTFGFFGTRRCVVRDELRFDVARLALYYRKRGFPQAQVDTLITDLAPDAIAVTFRVDEGPALRLDTLRVTGLEEVPDGDALARELGIAEGERFDQYALDTARVVLVQRLRNGGYPYADVLRGFTTHLATGSVAVDLNAIPGPRTRIGQVHLTVTPREGSTQQVPDDVARGLVGLSPGALYSERGLVEAQRRLYQTDAFAHVEITIDSLNTSAEVDTLVDVHVRLRETYMRTARLGVGYGTLDCFRVSGEFTDVNFLRTGRRLELNARTSKIGVGAPLDVNDGGLCFPEVRDDVYSDTLNYYVGATFRTPRVLGYTLPTTTFYSERRSEFKAFLRTTPIALGLSRNWPRGLGLGVPLVGTYNLEYGRTEAQPALLCAAFNLCEADDRERVGEFRRLAVLGASAVRDRTDDPVEPTRGTILRLDARHASPLVGSDGMQAFNQLSGSASWYQAVADGLVLAARLRLGAVLSSSFASGHQRFVPPQERLYAGGPSTVRGFQQNELGPVVYLANGYDTVTVSTPSGPQ
ncbi:MAG TPA: POTRA domain-containing protein, partial [Gemmatimonadaceae bacterium]|nr:POTRA domain-containing protein [Gemmatimonadaceae bacterium]